MPAGKKLVLAVLLLAAGVSTALFFRKDAAQSDEWQEAGWNSDFRERVQRRVASDTEHAQRLAARRRTTAVVQERQPGALNATASIRTDDSSELTPTFQKSFHPIGSLLPPLESSPAEGVRSTLTADRTESDESITYRGEVTHKVVDGDTLSMLAARYLGKADRYLEIYERNRPLLSSPDLLPIGTTLVIPTEQIPRTSPAAPSAWSPAAAVNESRLGEIPPRPAGG